jgi:hypothetical protein
MKRNAVRIMCLLLPLALLGSGSAGGQSIFGLNYLGEHLFNGDSRYRALAFSAVAVPDTMSALTLNPASRADLSSVTFSIAEVLELGSARAGDETAELSRFQLPQLMLAVPIRPGLVFSLGYATNFMGKGDFAYPSYVEDVPIHYDVYKHRSSLFTAPLALAWKARDWLNVAAAFELERGMIRNDIDIEFYEQNYSDAESSRSRSFSGESFSVALLARIHPRLYIGGLWDHEVEYEVDESITYTRSEFDTNRLWKTTLPGAFGVGASAGLTGRWWLSAQYWRREAPEPEGFPQLDGSIGEEYLIAVGLERRRISDGGFLSRLPLRLGYCQNRWHLEIPAGEPVISRFFTAGTSFSLPGGPGRIDLSLELGQIGSLDSNGADERMARLGIGFSLSEPWTSREVESAY